MAHHIEKVQLAEQLGFAAVWLRDVPFNVPSFGDPGQTFDPFVYLGLLAGQTDSIGLGTGSIILPLRHPAHVAKMAATADALSGGRLIMGIASGDRPEEYPALNQSYPDRGGRFQASYDYIRQMAQPAAAFSNPLGSPYGGMDMLPKPQSGRIPMLITGGSQQSPEWIAQHGVAGLPIRVMWAHRHRLLAAGGSVPVPQAGRINRRRSHCILIWWPSRMRHPSRFTSAFVPALMRCAII